jgi:salicylate hydroxylase
MSVSARGAELTFDNDETAGTFDLIVAADGLYSSIRRQYLPEHHVIYKGAVAYRTIFPKSLVAHIQGLHDDSSAWLRNGEVVFLSELGLGKYGIVLMRPESPEYASKLRWEHSIDTDKIQRLRDLYKDWDPVIGKVLEVINDIQAYPLESGPWMPELHMDNRVAFIGDAAHPTAGAYGAGAAMGFCDAWALRRALQGTRSRTGDADRPGGYNVAAALRAFQATRAPFLRRVETQMALDKEDARYVAAAGDDEEEWMARFDETKPQDQWLTEHDVELEVQNAIMAKTFERRQSYVQEAHL